MKKTITTVISVLLLLSAIILCGCDKNGSSDATTSQADTTTVPAAESGLAFADLCKYTVICSENASDEVSKAVSKVHNELSKLTPDIRIKDDFYKEGTDFSINEYEIIIGSTNRPETAELFAGMKRGDWGYRIIGKKIVIGGLTDNATIIASERFIDDVIKAYKSGDEIFYKSEQNMLNETISKYENILIDGSKISEYVIVYPSNNVYSESAYASSLRDYIADYSGEYLGVYSDSNQKAKNAAKRIIIGNSTLVDDTMKNAAGEISSLQNYIAYGDGCVWLYGTSINGINSAVLRFKNEIDTSIVKGEKSITLKKADTGVYTAESSEYTAMSFNIYGIQPDDARKNRVLGMILNTTPDLIGLQEVSPLWYDIIKLKFSSAYGIIGVDRDNNGKTEYSNVMYLKDKFNLIESGTKWLSDTPDTVSKYPESSRTRIFTYALLENKSDGSTLLYINTHFDHLSAVATAKQAKALLKFTEQYKEYPIIITGDFNDYIGSDMYNSIVNSERFADSSYIADVTEHKATFHGYENKNNIIDFCFVTKDKIKVGKYDVLNKKVNGDYASDHHPILINFSVIK